MDNYDTSHSKNLDVRSSNNQIIEYIPLEEVTTRPQAEEFSFGELWRRLLQRKWLLLSIALSIFLLSVLITLTTPYVYRASTTLQITAEDTRNSFTLSEADAPVRTPLNERDYYQTQTELLRSRTLAQKTINELGIASQFEKDNSLSSKLQNWVMGWRQKLFGQEVGDNKPSTVEDNFQRGLAVFPIENSQIFRITYDSRDPKLAADIVNTLADGYKEMNFDLRNEKVARAKRELGKKLEDAKKELATSEAQLVGYAKKQNIITLDGDRSSASEVMDSFNRALVTAKDARIAAEAAYNRSRDIAGADRTLENPAVQRLKEELAKVEAEYRDKSSLFKPGFPEMQQLQGRIDELKSKITHEESSIDTTTRGRLKADYDAAVQRESELTAAVKRQEGLLMGQRDKSVEYNTLLRKVEADRKNYDGLLERLNQVTLAEDSSASNVAVVDRAAVPSKPYAPNIPLNLGLGAAIGLMLGLLSAVLADIMDDRLRNVEDMKRTIGSVPLMGVIPYISGRNNKNVLALRGAQVSSSSFMLEAFRSLRENILMLNPNQPHGLALIINITSPSPGEGKTTTAVNLATVFAYAKKRVLLLDCDMRNPEAHNKLNIKNTAGVSDYLMGNKDLHEIIQDTPVENLSAIPAGAVVPNPTELLASERFGMLLSEAEGIFDHIIIDGPPVMGLADALILSNRAGNTLLVGAYSQTRKRNLKDAYSRLLQGRSNVIGMILTKMKSAEVSNKYYGYPTRYPRSNQSSQKALIPAPAIART